MQHRAMHMLDLGGAGSQCVMLYGIDASPVLLASKDGGQDCPYAIES